MYTTAKKLSIFCVIIGAINTFMGLGLMAFAVDRGFTFFEMFALCFYILTSSAFAIIMTCAMRSLCSDLEYSEEVDSKNFIELKKQVEELEYRVKH